MPKLLREKPTTNKTNKFTYRLFSGDNGFYPSILGVANQMWGGKTDPSVQKVTKFITDIRDEYMRIRDKYIRALGKPEGAGYTMSQSTPEDAKEYDEAMEELNDEEFSFPEDIKLPVTLKIKKKNAVTPLQAALVEGIFEIEWTEDSNQE